GAVRPLRRARRVRREQHVAAARIEAEPLPWLRARYADEALEGDAARKHRDAPAPSGAGDLARELWADRGHEVVTGQRRGGDAARARMAEVRAVEGHDPGRMAAAQRGPRGQAEMGVDDVEALAPVPPPQVARGA